MTELTSEEKVRQEVQKFDPDRIVTLYELDLSILGGPIIYFTPATLEDGNYISYGGNTYVSYPIDAEGFDRTGSGTLPNPTLRVSNVLGGTSAILQEYSDLVGCFFRRIRTFRKYLDDQPTADPEAVFPIEEYKIDKKVSQNKVYIEWELRSALDQTGKYIPRRVCLRNYCMHRYRIWMKDDTLPEGGFFNYSMVDCPYVGTTYYDRNSEVVATPDKDVCGKQLKDCKKRFGDTELPFGGFPGMAK